MFLKRMCQRYGEPPERSVPAKAIKAALNLVSVLFGQVYLPTYSNGLKENASFVGAQWRSPDASGLQTIVWRCQWERTHVGSLKDQLVAYNQDDCAALTLLTEELVRLRLESKPEQMWILLTPQNNMRQSAARKSTAISRNCCGRLT
jgi:predicted RecB family nuclease